ncbi:MAG: hypothetical protein GTO62_12085, partial [Planctomycetales bacterium]|nr:hypothetical protein [Planctomycetales bacterium]NIP69982.1 hypothetical protein [Planctomycetales bacterium]
RRRLPALLLMAACGFWGWVVDGRPADAEPAVQGRHASVLDLFPSSGLPSKAGQTRCSFAYEPSGSTWNAGVDERHVFFAFIQGEGWRLGVGKGGHIYSLRGPYGESVPPQRELSPWNDEVWQSVITSEVLADPIHQYHGAHPDEWGKVFPLLYFVHQAGIYVKGARPDDDRAPAPFYSPCLRKQWNGATKTLRLVNWMQQANSPCVWKSGVLIYTAYRDLGEGIIEVDQVLHNFGSVPLDYLSTPWGGVRKSSLPHTIISKADGSWAEEEGLWNWDDVPELRLPQAGGWAAWVQNPADDASPALSLVFGTQHVQGNEDRPADFVKVPYRVESERKILWGTAGKAGERDYEAAEQVTKLALRPGESCSLRWFLVSGKFGHVRQVASRLVAHAEIKTISFDAAAIQSVWAADGRVSTSGEGAPWAGFLAFPAPGSVPVFLLKDRRSGEYLVTTDIYALAPSEPFPNPLPPDHAEYARYQNRVFYKQYSPHIGYEDLLGYAYPTKPIDKPAAKIEAPPGVRLHPSAQNLWLPQ